MKQQLSQLAIFGGQPSFYNPLQVGCVNIPQGEARNQFLQHVSGILDRGGQTSQVPLVVEFERAVANKLNVRNVIAVGNATQALQVIAHACGFTGEVIVPAFASATIAHALNWIGLEPVFADVDPNRHTIDPEQIESLITTRTSAIVAAHLWGNACSTEQLAQIAHEHRLQVVYDASHAFGGLSQGQMIGSFGCAEIFSFHVSEFSNSFECGVITTNDDEFAQKIRRMTHGGVEGFDHISGLATNAKISEVAAAMGLVTLNTMEELTAINRLNYEAYSLRMTGLPGVRLLPFDGAGNYQYAIAEVRGKGLSRDQLMEVLWTEGIHARRYASCHQIEPYASRPEIPSLPVTERFAETTLSLPTGTAVTPTEIATICSIIRLAMSNADEVKQRLARTQQAAA